MELHPREALLTAIAEEIKDYREGELPTPTPEHVDRWISQFDKGVQLPLLNAFARNLIYLSRKIFSDCFAKGYLMNEKMVGNDPKTYWSGVSILNIQHDGQSQKDILRLVDDGLKEHFGLDLTLCDGSANEFIYFDDVLFSGNRVRQDLILWIKEHAPRKFKLNICMVVVHSLGEYYTEKALKEVAQEWGKEMEIAIWRSRTVETRKMFKNDSEVLWPTALPVHDLMKAYLAERHRFPFDARTVEPRAAGKHLKDEEERQLLEQEFLLAGLKIRSGSHTQLDVMRPLGYSPFGLGFGSMIVTYRNCPNNCPLALWWGDPRQHPTGPLSIWYGLFPRRTYGV